LYGSLPLTKKGSLKQLQQISITKDVKKKKPSLTRGAAGTMSAKNRNSSLDKNILKPVDTTEIDKRSAK
jgi:hypothetical protein